MTLLWFKTLKTCEHSNICGSAEWNDCLPQLLHVLGFSVPPAVPDALPAATSRLHAVAAAEQDHWAARPHIVFDRRDEHPLIGLCFMSQHQHLSEREQTRLTQ